MESLFEDPALMLRRKVSRSPAEADGGRRLALEGPQNGYGAGSDGPLEHVAAGAFEATLSGEIADANRALVQLLGYPSRQELVGGSLADLLGDRATFDRVLGHARGGQELAGEEVPLRTKQGDEAVVLLCTKLVGSAGTGGRRVVGTLMDITERKRRESDLERLAFEDPLTGLANRRALDEHAAKYLALAERRGALVGLLYLDVTRFKAINDRFGHSAGDAVLVEVARRLEAEARESDVVGRVGGDEFVVLLPDVEDLDAVVTAARRMTGKVEERPVELEEASATVTVRAEGGISVYPAHGECIDELVRAADQAMYDAKKANGNAESPAEEAEERVSVIAAAGERPSPQRARP